MTIVHRSSNSNILPHQNINNQNPNLPIPSFSSHQHLDSNYQNHSVTEKIQSAAIDNFSVRQTPLPNSQSSTKKLHPRSSIIRIICNDENFPRMHFLL